MSWKDFLHQADDFGTESPQTFPSTDVSLLTVISLNLFHEIVCCTELWGGAGAMQEKN